MVNIKNPNLIKPLNIKENHPIKRNINIYY